MVFATTFVLMQQSTLTLCRTCRSRRLSAINRFFWKKIIKVQLLSCPLDSTYAIFCFLLQPNILRKISTLYIYVRGHHKIKRKLLRPLISKGTKLSVIYRPIKWGLGARKPVFGGVRTKKSRPACASAQSD